MKRLNWLFFAFILIQALLISNAYADPVIDASFLSLQLDRDNNGYTNFGDQIRIETIATFTTQLEFWLVPPFVDCTNLGMGEFIMNQINAQTGHYRVDIDLDEWRAGLNPGSTSVTISGRTNLGAIPTNPTNTILFDLVQVAGTDPTVSPPVIPNGQDITISITDGQYQTYPYGGTKAYVNLAPIGGGTNVDIPYSGTPVGFFTLTLDASTQLYLANREYTGPLQITLKDPLHPAMIFVSNDFILDTRPSVIDAAQTRIQVLSGNATALAGDIIRLTARVTQYDNETVTVTIPTLTSGANPAGISAGVVMPLITSSGEGNPAVWQQDVILSEANIKSNAMLVTFSFEDDAGNINTVDRTFAIDLDKPAFNYLTANILLPGGTDSTINVGTTTCQLEIVASIPIDAGPDTITVQADLTPIGGPAAQNMTQIANGDYRCVYTIPAGTLEDTANFSFQVRAVDQAGNTVLQGTTPDVQIDNVQPTIGTITITSVEQTVIAGEDFTIAVEANLIETGGTSGVFVNLSGLGLGNAEQLTIVTGNVYSQTFTLPTAAVAGFAVEGPKTFTVTARDSIAAHPTVIAHTVNATTPAHKFYNGNLIVTSDVFYPDNTDSPHEVATTTCKIIISATVPATGAITPLTASVDLSPIGGPAAQAMPRVGASDQYRTEYVIPAGALEDNVYHTFVVSVRDKDNVQFVQRSTTPPIGIDSVRPTLSGISITAAQPTILAGMDFTISCTATNIEAGSVTVDLSSIGLSALSTLNFQTGTTYSQTFTLPTEAAAGFAVDGAKSFRVSANDTIAADPTMISHMVSDLTSGYKIYNRPYTLVANVLNPNNSDSPNEFATTTCKLEITANMAASGNITPLTVTVNLSSVGGPAALSMPKMAGLDQYRVVWTIPPGALEDDVTYSFPVTVMDKDNVQVLKENTQPIVRIDNTLPVITSATLTNSDADINVGDVFTITVNATGVEMGSVTVDLSAIDLSFTSPDAPTMVFIPENPAGSGIYTRSFTLKDSIRSGIVRDAQTSFRVSINDTVYDNILASDVIAHLVTANTNSMMIDNEPPFIAGIATNSYHNVNIGMDDGHVRIQDYLSFHANIASASQSTGELSSIIINMLPLGQSGTSNMTASPSSTGWFDYMLPGGVATGTINRINTGFNVTATDNAGNATSTFIYVPIDNQPLTINDFIIDASTYKPGYSDSVISTINFNKIVSFNIPYGTFASDHSTGTIDLTVIGSSAAALLASDTASYSILVPTASTTFEALGHAFRAMLYDLAGNSTMAVSNGYRVDCQLPSIVAATATIQAGTSPLGIGDKIRFDVWVQNNEGTGPTLDLTSLGGSSAQTLIDTGSGRYALIFDIATGTLDGLTPASWVVKAFDNDQNYVTTYTTSLTVDNKPQVLATGLNVTIASGTPNIRIGNRVDFELGIVDTANAGNATVDLTAIGGSSAQAMNYLLGTYTYSFVATEYNQEFANHIFTAKIYDANGNLAYASSTEQIVDCQPVKFSSSGIVISQTNGDNPIATVANINDVLTVYASAAAYLDATVQATIGSGTVDFATGTMTFNSSLNRHEVTFTVAAPGTGGWGIQRGNNIYFKLTAVDDVGNVANMVQANSAFTVRNEPPTVTATFTLNPDYGLSNPVYNLGTSTVGDLLNVTCNFANDVPINKAWLDFSQLGSGTFDLTINGSSATTLAGIGSSKFAAFDGINKEIYLIARDDGGNSDRATATYFIDNVAPKISSTQFDGSIIKVNLSEEYTNASLNIDEWTLVGSNTIPVGTTAYLNFPVGQTVNHSLTDFEIVLDNAQKITVAQWASTSLYLQVTNTASSAVSDLTHNEIRPVNFSPVTITDSSWREPARVTSLVMTQTWPTSIVLDFTFNKDVDPATLQASAGVLLFKNLTYDYSSVDYADGYVIQPTLDTISWSDNKHLRITLSGNGREWVARKLGNGSNKLRFATRSGRVFVKDFLTKDMQAISSQAALEATDNRPTPAFDFDAATPELDMASRSLKLTSSDRLLLFTNDFARANATEPLMLMPVPTLAKRVSGFHNKITLHEFDSGSSVVLQLEDLQLPTDNLYASSTIALKLTATDVNNVINLFQSSAAPDWRLQINGGAFTNLWGTNNTAYLPSGNPGPLNMIYPAGYNPVTVAACSMSDKPPVSQKTTGQLTFEVEVYPANLDGVDLPVQTQIQPTAQIIRQDTGAVICNGTFVSYTNRTVNSKTRTVARFTNAADFPTSLQRIPARIEVNGIRDIFNASYNVVASFAYDLALKNDTAPDGFSDTASAPIQIDTQKPTVVQVIPGDYIGRLPAGSEFRVEFSEAMDPLVVPTLRLATGTTTMSFTFHSWLATDIAKFTNNTAFTSATTNGTWTWEVTGGRDEATNTHDGTSSFLVEVRTYAPEVAAGNVRIRTVQTTIDNTVRIDQPWSQEIGAATFAIQYTTAPTQYLPHYLEIYDDSNVRYGRVPVTAVSAANTATATFASANFDIDPGLTGPTTYRIRIIDSAMNQTESVANLVYDNLAPDVNSFALTGIGSESATVSYYNPSVGNFTLNVTTTSTTDSLRLAIYSYATNATTTYNMNQPLPGNYQISTGDLLTNGTYTLSIVDLAGNIGTGPSVRRLIVDNQVPTVLAVSPSGLIGNSPIGGTTFTVIFSDNMDASLAVVPTLTLATSSATISMNFAGWADPAMASTAYYTNAVEIASSMPSGFYNYSISGGRDLAGNAMLAPSAGTFKVEIQTKGPFAQIDVYTDQAHIYATQQKNLAYNPAFGPATFNIDYSGGPFNTQHSLLIFDSTNAQVASIAIPIADPASIVFAGVLASGTYRFKIRDAEDNISGSYLPEPFYVDVDAPTINNVIAMQGSGIASDTGAGLIHFLSPRQGNSTFLATTTANEELIMLLRDISPATSTYPMVGSTTAHSVSIGSTLADGAYDVLFADRAGNIAIGTASSARLIVDSASPTVTVATPNISGGIAAGTGVFVITFDEHMNTAIAPTATIATGSTIINLGSPVWLDSFRCQFTNSTNLSGFAPGSYSYQVTGARDLAGNPNVNPTPGSFSIDLFTQAPVVTAALRSQQSMLSGNTELINRPFSINAMPGVASLSLSYSSGPFQAPHNMLVYNSSNQLVSNIVVNPDIANKVATVTVDAAFFGSPGNVGPGEYRFRMVDSIGNLSATNTLPLIYDAIGPVITAANISTVSDGSNNPLYYNQALHGDLKVKFTSTATDSLLLVAANGFATAAYSMTLNDAADEYSATVTTAQAALLSTGTYVITAFDLAGNMASGAASTTVLIIDRDIPQVLSVLSLNGTPLTSEPIGGATFTVTFNEPMKASATPVLKIATSTKTIACTFESWLSTTQARFVTAEAITPDLPQGEYSYQVTGTDLTGNVLNNAVVGTVQIRSRGPVIASIYATSYQSTTASGTSEILRDMPFSFNVAPGAATLTVQLAQAPDAAPIDLHFMQSGVTVASYPLVLSGTAATFTWSATNGPNPAFPTTYQVKLVDATGDFSLESYNWTMDASAPVALTDPTVTRGVIATGAVYFNPARHSYLNVKFSASETSAPKMRVRGGNSTDTYDLSTAGTNQWSGNFDGRFSRGTSPKPLMPDGTYALDLVDQAGNVGILASGDPILYNIVIDTQSPGISTYSTLVAGLPVTSYSPAAGNLEIRVVSGETLNETGIYWMEVLNSSNIKINQLRVNNSGGNKSAFWDGKNSAGTTVLDGIYSFRATDYAGNPATGSISVFALTTAFKVVGVSQISSSTAKLIFNHEVNPNLSGAIITAPGLTVTNLNRIEPQAVSFTVVPNFAHLTNYTFTITPNTIRSIYGAGITAPDNTGTLAADGQGPKLTEVSFAGLSGQQEFKVIFDETFNSASAGVVGNYSLTGPGGAVALSAATTQSDSKTVLLTASQNLIENADYQISVTGIEDIYGNLSPAANSLSFKGRDLTPPVLEVSAFSNPANENDIIVVVVSNEDLKAAPVLQIAQSNAPIVTTTMQTGANSKSFMIGVHLSTSYPGNGTLLATAQDLAGNQGSGNSTFTVAYISASKVASLVSADNGLTAEFAADSLKEDAVIKIMTHRLEKGSEANSQIRTALQQQAKFALGMRAAQTASSLNQTELEPVSDAYEISISSTKVNKGFNVFVEMPAASSATGLGLFYQENDQWKFISAAPTRGNKLATRISTSQMLAILHDTKAPEVTLSADINLAEPFRTVRPEFRGKIVETGSGLDLTTISASIDSGPAQNVTVDANGNFTFIPQADLTGGWHDLVIRASDNTGNVSAMAPARFEVTVPLQITQIAQYPNPARVRTFIRISANRGDIDESLVRVRIYDVAGHKVATLDGIRPVNEKWGINARFVYDIPWDLRNAAGKDVANGVYFARIEVRDPDDQNRKVKETFKIAILR